ncbi:MAG: sigma-70 region 4 domain-containing protein [Planctomycetia bacterium]|nr:sigma-70 region 4 domain-containing protein [Planctomycetia bacterium]
MQTDMLKSANKARVAGATPQDSGQTQTTGAMPQAPADDVVYPGDHPIDDPALVELPRRAQREIDLEALDLHLAGYSVRQIARLQDVHPNTAFNRIKRGRAINACDPLRAEGLSLHAEAAKLRQIERAVLPAAIAGDLASVKLVLRILDKRWRLAKFARDNPRAAEMDVGCDARVAGATSLSPDDAQTNGALPQAPVDVASHAAATAGPPPRVSVDLPSSENCQPVPDDKSPTPSLDIPSRSLDIIEAQTRILRQRPSTFAGPAGFDDLLAEYRCQPEPPTAERPLSRKQRKRRKWAQREQRASAARTAHQHRANSSANAPREHQLENHEISKAGASDSRALHSP